MTWASWLSTTVFIAAVRSGSWQLLAPDIQDVGGRRHGVHGLHVQGLLAVPAGGVALVRA